MNPIKTKRMETLNEGTYSVPDDCTAVFKKRKVIVRKMKKVNGPKIFRCHDCAYQKIGRKARTNQLFEYPYCEIRPKVIHGESGYYHSAPDSRIACYMFKLKDDKK